jgi:hypothetical protein
MNISFSEKKKRKYNLKLDKIKSLLDIGTGIGFLKPRGLVGDKVAGILGTLSSVLGVVREWNSSK